MRPNPDSPSVAKPMSNLDSKRPRWQESDSARSSRPPLPDRSDAQRPEAIDYDDSSWM